MKKPTKQPDTDLAELNIKVVELAKMAQARKEELLREKDVAEVAAKKAEEEKQLKDSFTNGGEFAKCILAHFGPNDRLLGIGHRDIEILKVSRRCHTIEEYINLLKIVFKQLQDRFDGQIRDLHDPILEAKGMGPLPVQIKGGEASAKKEMSSGVAVLRANMEGFIDTILKSNPDTDDLLSAVKVAMVAGVDTFHEFGGRQKVLECLRTVVIAKIEEKLSTDADIDENGIEEIERILNEVGEAVKQQVKQVS